MRFVFASVTLLAACASPPAPPPGAPIGIAVSYETVAGGPADGAAILLEVEVWHGEWATGTPADRLAVAMTASSGRPFRAAAPGLAGVRFGSPAPAAGAIAARATAVVAAGLSTVLTVTRAELPQLLVRRVGAELRFGLRCRAGDGAGTTIVDLLPQPLRPDDVFALAADPGVERSGLVCALRVRTAVDPTAVAMARADAALAAARADRPLPVRAWSDLLPARSIGADARRGALLACFAVHGLPRATDLALGADERELVTLAEAVPAAPATAFDVERAVLQAVLPVMLRGQAPPAMLAGMRRHFGALADDPSTLGYLLADAADAAAFDLALRDANIEALGDRAADRAMLAAAWLGTHDVDVTAFDALSPRAERRRFAQLLHARTAGIGAGDGR